MRISSHAIDHPRFVLVASLLVLLMASYAALYIPVQRTPAISKAVVLVAIPYPDSTPEESEVDVSKKIEDALSELQSVDFLASTSLRGSSVTQIIFLDGVSPDDAKREVKDLVDRVRNELPNGRDVQPIVTAIDFEDAPLMLVTLSGPKDFDSRALKQIAEDVQKDLERVEGIANTQLFGGQEREIHVNVNPDRMTQYGLSLTDVRQTIIRAHAKIPAGSLNTKGYDRMVRNEAKLRTIKDVQNAIIRSSAGRPIRISDVAEVADSYRRVQNLALLDGSTCATIVVNKEANINTLGAAKAIHEKIKELEKQYPLLHFSVTRDTSDEISVMFRVLGSSALFGALLVLVILAWTMGLRISILVLMAIPFSGAVALAFLFATGVPVSNMVVFSAILVIGMVVDGAIIVAENIHRHIERGEDPVDAAKIGIEEVGMPVIAADLTTVAAYLPMLLVPGIMGDFMSVMPRVVSVALLGSVLVDHFLIPTLAARWYRKRSVPKTTDIEGSDGVIVVSDSPLSTKQDSLLSTKKTKDAKSPSRKESRIRPNLGSFTGAYLRVLKFALAHRYFVLLWCVMMVFGASLLFKHLGFEFFPESDRGQFTIKFELPLGYSIDESLAVANQISKPLEKYKQEGLIKHYVTALGTSNALASRLEGDPATGPEFGQIMVELLSPLDRSVHQDIIIDELRQAIEVPPGVTLSFQEAQEGPPGGYAVAIRFTGKNHKQLGMIAKAVRKRMETIGGTVDVSTDFRDSSPELIIKPNLAVLPMFDIQPEQISQAIQIAIAGDTTVQMTLDDKDVTVRIQLAPEFQSNISDLKRLPITSATGRKATIGQLATVKRDVGLYSINRYKSDRAVVAYCGVNKPAIPADVFKVLAQDILPDFGFEPINKDGATLEGYAKSFLGQSATPAAGIQADFAGENDERDKNFNYLLYSMIIAVVLIFVILVAQFNSIRQSLVVMLTVPLSFVGVICGMWATGFPFSLATFIGLVSLTGIVVNDAIVMVDFANQARKRGLPLQEALIESGVNRLRPVLLTTVTTIGGLLPLFLNISGGAEFWQPLTAAVIFGLGFATMLTLVVIPVCYSLAYSWYLPIVRLVRVVRGQ